MEKEKITVNNKKFREKKKFKKTATSRNLQHFVIIEKSPK